MDSIRSMNDRSTPTKTGNSKDRNVPEPARKRNKVARKLLLTLLILLLLGALGFFAWQYLENQKEIARLRNPEVAAQESTEQLVREVGQLIKLPEGETPTVAVVANAEELKEQPFFADAKNGDQVLIYTQAKEAILYRPSAKKIIKVAPVDLGNEK